jgi:glycosyltransferase involved in cell wall biosynthesis
VSSPPGSGARVTVIIPVYATAPFVADALDSVLSQTYTEYEIIVVNDGSPDSELLDAVLEPYRNRITYIVQENRGSSGARNTALKAARGQYVAMLDSDDRWNPEYLTSQLSVLDADPTIDVVYPDCVRFSSEGMAVTRYSEEYPVGGEISFLRVLARECHIYGAVTARRETLLRVGLYDEDIESGEDFELWLRVLKSGGRIVYNDRVLAYYRIREGSHTSNDLRLASNVLKVLNKVGREMELTARERVTLDGRRLGLEAMVNLLGGKKALIEGDLPRALTMLTAAADHSPKWKLRATVATLRLAPGIVRQLYRMRERWARWRDSQAGLHSA